MLVDGQWTEDWQPVQQSDDDGRFIRQRSSFRERIRADSTAGFAPEAGRYLLYVAYICPWACRTLIALRLKGLDGVIATCVVDPRLSDQGWRFSGEMGSDLDRTNGASHMHQLYTRADPHFTGRATVPVLWDTRQGTIVNNESADILRILDRDFAGLADDTVQLRPEALEDEIEAWNQRLYADFNNGVYQAGFASSQAAYDEAEGKVFATLDDLEARLGGADWLVGDQLTETDIRAFVTLVRFDLAYHGLFKCNRHPLSHYPRVIAYLERLLAIPAFAASVRPDHIKAGYYSIAALNPSGIVPTGPELDYLAALA
ncbi:MAG: glutathione S-transferase C-terminal domain-containing protein [Rhodocyclaceae bacterium]|nr:glutathione S-transferase C-terminal domain-containing protein [Rhodocyclaceae bacterium]